MSEITDYVVAQQIIGRMWPHNCDMRSCLLHIEETMRDRQDEIDRLRQQLAAAEQRCQRLEAFITRNMQMHSPKMDSQHSWRFMNHCMRGKGQTASEALWRSIEIEDQYIREAALAAVGEK